MCELKKIVWLLFKCLKLIEERLIFFKKIQDLIAPAKQLKVARPFGFNIKNEPVDDDTPWYTNETILICNECIKKEECLKEAEKNRNHMETSHQKEILQLQNKIDALTKERNNLLAQTRRNHDKGNSNEYEVEQLLAHKNKGNGKKMELQFLVRWKGFDSSNDTWERKSNLNCPLILRKYMKEHDL